MRGNFFVIATRDEPNALSALPQRNMYFDTNAFPMTRMQGERAQLQTRRNGWQNTWRDFSTTSIPNVPGILCAICRAIPFLRHGGLMYENEILKCFIVAPTRQLDKHVYAYEFACIALSAVRAFRRVYRAFSGPFGREARPRSTAASTSGPPRARARSALCARPNRTRSRTGAPRERRRP